MTHEQETIDKCETIVLDAETLNFSSLVQHYEQAQHEEDDEKMEVLLRKITREAKRLDPKNKWDEEEVHICLIEMRKKWQKE